MLEAGAGARYTTRVKSRGRWAEFVEDGRPYLEARSALQLLPCLTPVLFRHGGSAVNC